MRKIFSLCVLMLLWNVLIAQDVISDKDSVKNPKVFISGFGGLMSETSILKKNISESLGACGALMINNYFFLGAYGVTLVSNHTIKDLIIPDENLKDNNPQYYMGKSLRTNFSHAGIWVGGIFFPKKMVHFGVSSRFGWGNIHLTDSVSDSFYNNVDSRLDYTNDKIFVISPQIELEIKITSWLKFNMGFGYNFVTGIDFDRYKEYKFNSPQITVGIYFGGFSSKDEDEEIPETDTRFE